MKVTTYEITTDSGITTLVAEDHYDYKKREHNMFHNLTVENSGKEECVVCGKLTEPKLFIHLSTNGYYLPADCDEPEEYEGGEGQGWFAIGSGCASKFPKEFVKEI
jgi:hypothetical protein